MFKKILVLAEGADERQPALERAALCGARAADVVVLDVVHEPMLDGYLGNKAIYEPLRNRVLAERQERVAALAASLRKRGVAASGRAVWAVRREESVEEHARTEHADLVVMAPLDGSRHGLSSSDWRLLATSSVPVLVVKGPSDRQYRNIVAAVDPFHAHAKPADLDVMFAFAETAVVDPIGTILASDGVEIEDDKVNFKGGRPAGYWGTELDLGATISAIDGFLFDVEAAHLWPGPALYNQDQVAVGSWYLGLRATFFYGR